MKVKMKNINLYRNLRRDNCGTLFEAMKTHNCILAGGAIRCAVAKEEIRDYDIYFRSEESFLEFYEDFMQRGCTICAITNKAISFQVNGIACQAIFTDYFKDPKDIFELYDFTVCMGAYDFKGCEFVFDNRFWQDHTMKAIRYNPATKYPICSLMRVPKYERYGYKISKTTHAKMFINALGTELNSYEDLSNHFGGFYGLDVSDVFDVTKPFNKVEVFKTIMELDSDQFDFNPEPNTSSISPPTVESLKAIISGEKEIVYKVGDGFLTKGGQFFSNLLGYQEVYTGKYITGYKVVNRKSDGILRSQYKHSFIYTVGQTVSSDSPYIFFKLTNDFFCGQNSVIIRLKVAVDDLVHTGTGHGVQAKAVFVESIIEKD